MQNTTLDHIHAMRRSIMSTLEGVRHMLMAQQSADGSWSYMLEGGVLPDSYAIIVETLFPPPTTTLQKASRRELNVVNCPTAASRFTPSIPATSAPHSKLTWRCGWPGALQTLRQSPAPRTSFPRCVTSSNSRI